MKTSVVFSIQSSYPTIDSKAFRALFQSRPTLLDVRAPIEVKKASIPGAVNIPLLDDNQRALVGTAYKQLGQDEAIRLGWELATDEVVADRLAKWEGWAAQQSNPMLFCFRGGLRSQITHSLIRHHLNLTIPVIEGGYKALRNYLLTELEYRAKSSDFLVLAGPTGSGKTEILQSFAHSIDLEGCANHKGSAFGALGQVNQPNQVEFENQIACSFIRMPSEDATVLIEDESKLIGRCNLPVSLQKAMLRAPLVVIHEKLDVRIKRLLEDYVHPCITTMGLESFGQEIASSLNKIKKRFGHANQQEAKGLVNWCTSNYKKSNDITDFSELIRFLLQEYYDPMYAYQLKKRKERILFEGNPDAAKSWIHDHQYAI